MSKNELKEIDFLHIGLHKTASTWLQVQGFQLHPQIHLLNAPGSKVEELFVKEFIETPSFTFDQEDFTQKLKDSPRFSLPDYSQDRRCVYGLSEENFSGHYWNGQNAETLQTRLKQVFPETKIFIVIRNQLDMFNSLYSNYVKQGGIKSPQKLLQDTNIWGGHVIDKLCYDRFIKSYQQEFGKENVLVLCYEDLKNNPQFFMSSLFQFLDIEDISLPQKSSTKKVNPKLSIPSELALRLLNSLPKSMNRYFIRRGFFACDKTIFKHWHRSSQRVKSIAGEQALKKWKESNNILSHTIGHDLKGKGYLL